MPGFNGTGPMGQGPMTGRGRGFCVVPVSNSSRISGAGSYPVNRLYSYQLAYDRSFNLPYRYSGYSGRISEYFNFFRGRGVGRAFTRGNGMRGRSRRY